MAGMDALVGGRDLMEMIGLDPNSKDDIDRLTAWLNSHDVPYMSIGRAVRGRRRGILIAADELNAVLKAHFARRRARRDAKRADGTHLAVVAETPQDEETSHTEALAAVAAA